MDYIVLPSFPELKKEMDMNKLKKEKRDITDTYFCEDCCIYLLLPNINKHYKTKTHKNRCNPIKKL